LVDEIEQKVKFVFDATKVDRSKSDIKAWLDSVEQRVGLQPWFI
jgi:hypothetical protein